MIVNDLLFRLKDIDSDTPILFLGDDGGWSNIDINIGDDGNVYIVADHSSPFSDE